MMSNSTACETSKNLMSPKILQFDRAIPFRESKGPFGPFKATKIWLDLIDHLKEKVEVKRRRHKMRYVDSCFTGTDAVDVVLHFLLSDKDMFSPDLTRDKAVKVCQMLMQRKIFASAIEKSNEGKVNVFDDSGSKLYRFIGEHAIDANSADAGLQDTAGEEDEDENDGNTTQNLTYSSEKMRLCEHLQPEEEPATHDQARSLTSLQGLDSHFGHVASGRTSPTLEPEEIPLVAATPGRVIRHLTPEEIDDTWKEVALKQLLSLVELTFLDGILSEDKRSRQQQQRDHIIISNIVARSWHLPVQQDSVDTPADVLLQTAMDCIEFLPKGLHLLSEPVFRRQGMEAKLWAKDIIVKHFTGLDDPLLPRKYLELHLAILKLVLSNNHENAIAALQLYVILLPIATREELYRLLRFMRSLAKETALRLDPQVSNETAVLDLLADSIFQHKLVAPSVARQLVQFLVGSLDQVFTIPRQIRQKVTLRLFQLKTGKSLPECETTYCDRVSKEEFEKQSKDCTEESLVNLMNAVLDDISISLKEKRQRLKQFQKSYPDLYEHYFEGML